MKSTNPVREFFRCDKMLKMGIIPYDFDTANCVTNVLNKLSKEEARLAKRKFRKAHRKLNKKNLKDSKKAQLVFERKRRKAPSTNEKKSRKMMVLRDIEIKISKDLLSLNLKS